MLRQQLALTCKILASSPFLQLDVAGSRWRYVGSHFKKKALPIYGVSLWSECSDFGSRL